MIPTRDSHPPQSFPCTDCFWPPFTYKNLGFLQRHQASYDLPPPGPGFLPNLIAHLVSVCPFPEENRP